MAKALPAGRPIRRRPMFGLFDADGWGWATTKAVFWLLVIIMTLGYVPDRAYYFIVSRTIDLGILGWSPVNLCPPENGAAMPCPVPGGAILPWQPSPPQIALPAARTGGAAAQVGKNLLYIGGSDGTTASPTTYVSQVDNGTFGSWSEGPALPAARTGAAMTTLNGTVYLIGGTGTDGAPTDTVYTIGLDPDTSKLTDWKTLDQKLPEPRSGATAVAVSDGIVVLGGRDKDNKVSGSVWKSTLDSTGKLQAFKEQPGLVHPVANAAAAFAGTFLWVYGGTGDQGATGFVQRADYGAVPAVAASGAPAPASPAASAAVIQGVIKWATLDAANLPAARSGGAGFAANGGLYLVGGSDGSSPHGELYWALPNAAGDLPGGWFHLAATDLPGGLVDAAPVVAGSTVILIGGTASGGPVASSARASLAPQPPFFRLGLVGLVVPGLQIGGEIGQQLGYLAAAGVGTGNFVLLVAIGWAFNHRTQIGAWRDRRRREREAKKPASA
jgi:hypothetical protein